MSTTDPLLTDEVLSANILVIDDEPVNIKLVTKILQSKGYTNILSTLDGRETLPVYRGQKSDLIILDLNMPYMDGFQVMEELRRAGDPDLPPILVLTAQQSREFSQQALDGGASDFVTKPFHTSELLSRVRNLLRMHLANKFYRNQKDVQEERVWEATSELREANDELSNSHLYLVHSLARASEYKDNETGNHIIRVGKMARLLGESIGLDQQTLEFIEQAATMHDVGKIGIPDYVILKPGKFEPEEWEIMKTHSGIGAKILSEGDSPFLKMATEIALTHHEKWDGKGYPAGLKGENIPLTGRITAVVDVFDALLSKRPYDDPWEVDKAVEFIQKGAGSHFDPKLVEHFMKLVPKMVAIQKDLADKHVHKGEENK